MEKKQIEEAYQIAIKQYLNVGSYLEFKDYIKDSVNIGIQLALQNEVLLDERGNLIRIE